VDDELKLVGFLSKEMAGKHMMDKGFHYNQVLSKAEDRFLSLLHNQEWHSEAYKITKQIIRALFLQQGLHNSAAALTALHVHISTESE